MTIHIVPGGHAVEDPYCGALQSLVKLPVWLLFYWTTPEAAWSTEPVSPLMAASFAADERQLRIIIYDVKILNSTFSLPDFLHVSFKFNKCMHMYAYIYIYMLLVHIYIYIIVELRTPAMP